MNPNYFAGWTVSGEGPWQFKCDADEFGAAEVGVAWVSVEINGEWYLLLAPEADA